MVERTANVPVILPKEDARAENASLSLPEIYSGLGAIGALMGIEVITMTKDKPISNIRFEPGIHISNSSGLNDLAKAYQTGENAHVWNTQVTERIAGYQPSVLAIDSLTPSSDAFNVWLYMPDRARNINTHGPVFVLGADFYFGNNLKDSFQLEGIRAETVAREVTHLADNNGQYATGFSNFPSVLTDFATGPFLKILPPFILGAGGYRIYERLAGIKTREKTSRRDFLKRLGGLAFATSTAGLLAASTEISSITNEESLKNVFQIISYALRPQIIEAQYANGRTALLIEKEEQALSLLKSRKLIPQNGVGAAIMGYGHGFEAQNYLDNAKSRTDAIRKYAESVIQTFDKALSADKNISGQDKTKIVNNVLDYFSSVNIFRVTDSNAAFPNPEIGNYIESNIKTFGKFICPSIDNATRYLRT